MLESLRTKFSETVNAAGNSLNSSEKGVVASEGATNNVPAKGDTNHLEDMIDYLQGCADEVNSIVKASETTKNEKGINDADKGSQKQELVLCGIF